MPNQRLGIKITPFPRLQADGMVHHTADRHRYPVCLVSVRCTDFLGVLIRYPDWHLFRHRACWIPDVCQQRSRYSLNNVARVHSPFYPNGRIAIPIRHDGCFVRLHRQTSRAGSWTAVRAGHSVIRSIRRFVWRRHGCCCNARAGDHARHDRPKV